MDQQHVGGARPVSRRAFLSAAGALAGAAAWPRTVRAQAPLKIGYVPVLAIGALGLAIDRGYLRDVGLAAEMIAFNAGAELVAALGTGELDAAFAGVSPGLFNAWNRGVGIRMVADGSRLQPGYGITLVVVRTDLAGAIQRGADLRGRRVSLGVLGSAADYLLRNLLEQHGLSVDDVESLRLPNADVSAGLAGRSIDVAGVTEPFGALVEQSGLARRWLGADQVIPGTQAAGLFISEQASRDRAQTVALTAAYLRGVRDYLPGQTGDPGVIESISRWSGVRAEVLLRCVPSFIDPNGAIDSEDLRRQQAFWQRHGVIDRGGTLEDRVDRTIAEDALRLVGRVST